MGILGSLNRWRRNRETRAYVKHNNILNGECVCKHENKGARKFVNTTHGAYQCSPKTFDTKGYSFCTSRACCVFIYMHVRPPIRRRTHPIPTNCKNANMKPSLTAPVLFLGGFHYDGCLSRSGGDGEGRSPYRECSEHGSRRQKRSCAPA